KRAWIPAVANRQLPVVIHVVFEVILGLWKVRADMKPLYIEPATKSRRLRAGQFISHLDLERECTDIPNCLELVVRKPVSALQVSDLSCFDCRRTAFVTDPRSPVRHKEVHRKLHPRGNWSKHIELYARSPAPRVFIPVINDNRPMPDSCAYANGRLEYA